MRAFTPLAPLATQVTVAVATACASSVVLAGAGLAVERRAVADRGHPATLLVAITDPDGDRRAATAAGLAADLGGNPGLSVRRLPPAEVGRAVGPAGMAAALPSPEVVEVGVPSRAAAEGLAASLHHRPSIETWVEAPARTPWIVRPGALALSLLALFAAGWTAHLDVRRRAAWLLLMLRVGGSPGRLLVEALVPPFLSGLAGASGGDAILAVVIPAATGGPAAGAGLLLTPSAVLAAALVGALGSLRRLVAADP